MTSVEQQPQVERKPVLGMRFLLGVAVVFVLLGVLIFSGITNRVAAAKALRRETSEAAIPTVAVFHPKAGASAEEIALPGNVQAFTDAPIYARTNGYLKKWYVDIGTHVTAGQLLAEIDAPEVDHELQQARADLGTAQANLKLAESTAARWQFLLKSDSVSKQETDEKIGDLNAKKAMVESALSNVKRLEDLQSYERVYAPFAGVITARNTDLGALINSGANTPGKELFHLASLNRLRVFVSVPEVYQRGAVPGTRATLTADAFPNRTFTGTLARNANAIDQASRTLLIEVDVVNPTGELLPGAYVQVHLKLPQRGGSAITVPANALLFRSEGLRVAVVRNGQAQLVPITVGRDYGDTLEILSGLRVSDDVIINPPDSLTSGTPVRIAGRG